MMHGLLPCATSGVLTCSRVKVFVGILRVGSLVC